MLFVGFSETISIPFFLLSRLLIWAEQMLGITSCCDASALFELKWDFPPLPLVLTQKWWLYPQQPPCHHEPNMDTIDQYHRNGLESTGFKMAMLGGMSELVTANLYNFLPCYITMKHTLNSLCLKGFSAPSHFKTAIVVKATKKRTCCSSRRPTFGSQHPHGCSQLSMTPVLGNLRPSFGPHRYCKHIVHIHICR